LCRNNKWAISTPTDDQFGGYGIAERALGYSIQTYRVDGNDIFAVINTVKAAREFIIKNKAPAFIEFMTYRVSFEGSLIDRRPFYFRPLGYVQRRAGNSVLEGCQ
jgi:2-oxoisovalerate dehydrogenase E1 component alpha subunit